jgi:hypothetical protein
VHAQMAERIDAQTLRDIYQATGQALFRPAP